MPLPPNVTQGCMDQINAQGGTLCDQGHCAYLNAQMDQYMHAFCNCRDKNNQEIRNCTVRDANSPIPVLFPSGDFCYCCCSCFAYGTPIAVSPNEFRAIEEFRVGDPVLVADVSGGTPAWRSVPVIMSNGTGPQSHQPAMIYLSYGEDRHLVATADQLFLVPGGKIKRADRLVPGLDQLVDPEGNPVPLMAMHIGAYTGGVHHIATGLKPTTELDGHLINSNGVVSSDYSLQIGYVGMDDETRAAVLVDNHDALPVFGTPEYAETHTHLQVTRLMATHPDQSAEIANPAFKPLSELHVAIPAEARTFVSDQQAADIRLNAKIIPVSAAMSRALPDYLFRLFGAFYPDVDFLLDWGQEDPNAYAFRRGSKQFVVLSGALVRTPGMGLEGLSVVLAHEIGHLKGGQPQDESGYSCEGQADYFGVAMVLREVFYGQLYPMLVPRGIQQIGKVFGYISDANREGDPANSCLYPSTDCRLQAMQSAMMMIDPPPCMGGPARLEVSGAEASPDGVLVTFSMPVNAQLASLPGNYTLDPQADVTSAAIEEGDGTQVHLTATPRQDVAYTLTVMDIASAAGAPLSGDRNTATFTLAAPGSGDGAATTPK